eukprot:1325695-Amphidinium_carterae.1
MRSGCDTTTQRGEREEWCTGTEATRSRKKENSSGRVVLERGVARRSRGALRRSRGAARRSNDSKCTHSA